MFDQHYPAAFAYGRIKVLFPRHRDGQHVKADNGLFTEVGREILKMQDHWAEQPGYPYAAKAGWVVGYPIGLAFITVNMLPHTGIQLLGDSVDDVQTLWTVNINMSGSTVKQMGEFGENGWNYIATYFDGLFGQGGQKQ